MEMLAVQTMADGNLPIPLICGVIPVGWVSGTADRLATLLEYYHLYGGLEPFTELTTVREIQG